MNFTRTALIRRALGGMLLPVVAAMLLFSMAACAEQGTDDDLAADTLAADTTMMDMGESIASIVAGDARFSTLATALDSADLVMTLDGEGPYTVFAPTNEAFAALPAGTVDELLMPENREQLRAVLLYHVVSGENMAQNVQTMTMATTLQGDDVEISTADGNVMVGGATVTEADIDASNGVIHVIDTVLMPSEDASM